MRLRQRHLRGGVPFQQLLALQDLQLLRVLDLSERPLLLLGRDLLLNGGRREGRTDLRASPGALAAG